MGQSSSINSKTALPSNNLLIDASDSYVTDVKLRSTGIIPISEYIKKDKYNKNLSRLKQGKKNAQEEKEKKSKEIEVQKSKLETIKEEKSSEKDARAVEKKKVPQNHLQNEVKIEDKKKEKQQFIESSFEDIRNKRKWIKASSHQNRITLYPLSKNGRNRKTQTKFFKMPKKVEKEFDKSSSEEIKQLYKNDVYPHIYKNKFRTNLSEEHEEQQNNQKKEKIQEPIPESDKSSVKTDVLQNKFKPFRKKEESTHHLNVLQCNPSLQVVKKHKDKSLVVQTNVACVIHPDRNLYYRTSSEEIVKKPQHSYLKKFCPNPNFFKKEVSRKERKNYVSPNTSNTKIQQKIEKIDKAVEEHRKCLSAKQALENWKNIHTVKQYRKLNQPNYDEYQENHITNNRNSYIDDRNNDEYLATNSSGQTEFVPPRQNRSRAGNRETDRNESEIHCEMTPMEISNYNYSKLNSNGKMQYISRQKLKERNQRIKNRNTRDNNNYYERPGTSRYQFIEDSTYSRYPQQSRYQDYDSPKYQDNDVRTIFYPNNDRYHRNKTAPEMSERVDNNMGRTTRKNMERRDFMNINATRSMDRNMGRSMDRNMERSMARNMDRSMDRNMGRSMDTNMERSMDRNMERSMKKNMERPIDRNMEKIMDREDFIIDMERCLRKHQIMSNTRSPQSPTSGRTTWVQDKYRRWHKIQIE